MDCGAVAISKTALGRNQTIDEKRKVINIKRVLCMLFCMTLMISAAGMTMQVRASEAVNYDVSAGDVIISTDGDYIITGQTELYTIQIAKDVNANITLDNVSVTTGTGAAPLEIAENSSGNVTITLKGKIS